MIIDTDNNTISDDGLRWTTRDALIHVSKQLADISNILLETIYVMELLHLLIVNVSYMTLN
jgi:hypothetical protein